MKVTTCASLANLPSSRSGSRPYCSQPYPLPSCELALSSASPGPMSRSLHSPGALPAFLRGALAVLSKDLAIELATREIVTTAGFFAALVAVMASVAFTTGPETTTRVAPGALWLAIAFAAVLALGRSWQREREESALVGLLVSPVPRAAIWFGKAAGVFAFV